MGNVVEGKFRPNEPDHSKHYMCYFCEEEVEFIKPSDKDIKEGYAFTPLWVHSDGSMLKCNTVATPSNIEIPPAG